MKIFTHAWLALILVTGVSLSAHAQVSVDGSDAESLLPLNAADSRPATDLYYQEHILLPDEAANLARAGTDIST